MRRRPARRFAIWLVAVLLLTQWATAVYACPRESTSSNDSVAAAMRDCEQAMPAGPMDADQRLLCKAHCDHALQTVNDSPTAQPIAHAAAFVWTVLDWSTVATTHADNGAPRSGPWDLARASPAAPVYLLLHVLRN